MPDALDIQHQEQRARRQRAALREQAKMIRHPPEDKMIRGAEEDKAEEEDEEEASRRIRGSDDAGLAAVRFVSAAARNASEDFGLTAGDFTPEMLERGVSMRDVRAIRDRQAAP